MVSAELKKKAKYGKIVNSDELIQVPNLDYSPKKGINENPYIILEDIFEKYHKVKGKAIEEEFWQKVKIEFEEEKVRGYNNDQVYPINEEKDFVVETKKEYATLYFWGPDNVLDEKEKKWLWQNTKERKLYFNGNPTHFFIFTTNI